MRTKFHLYWNRGASCIRINLNYCNVKEKKHCSWASNSGFLSSLRTRKLPFTHSFDFRKSSPDGKFYYDVKLKHKTLWKGWEHEKRIVGKEFRVKRAHIRQCLIVGVLLFRCESTSKSFSCSRTHCILLLDFFLNIEIYSQIQRVSSFQDDTVPSERNIELISRYIKRNNFIDRVWTIQVLSFFFSGP